MPQPDKKPRLLGGPYVQLVAFCDKVLEEKDGTISLIRVIDSFSVPVVVPPNGDMANAMPLDRLNGTLVIGLRSGTFTGTHDVVLVLHQPNGVPTPPTRYEVVFQGGEMGTNLLLPYDIGVVGEGVYWLSVSVGERELSRAPMTVRYQVAGHLEAEAEPEPEPMAPTPT